ncbi:ATP-binding protein [Nocardioides sp.]|uniref:ATP-binding protein n=1 Tax=Nocardioides sp. TaxID=35761 RepID=UPI0035147CAC
MSDHAPPGGPLRWEVTAPAEPAVVDTVQDGLVALWREGAVDPHVALRLELGLVEIVANIVEHAYDPAETGREITVVVEVAPGRVTASAWDNGRPTGIDLSTVALPEDDAESGRGLAMALAALDELRYERDGERNRWSLVCLR